MIHTLEHWFKMVEAPASLADAIEEVMRFRGYGYSSPRQDNTDGKIHISNMFLILAKAAQAMNYFVLFTNNIKAMAEQGPTRSLSSKLNLIKSSDQVIR